MATGRSTQLAGQVGEYLVAAQMCRLGMIAATFSGNVEHFDILASRPDGVGIAVQVKAIRTGDWQLNASRFLDIEMRDKVQAVRGLLPEPHPGLLCVFVRLGASYGGDEFFVVSWLQLQRIVERRYRGHLEKIGGVRPRNPESMHTAVSVTDLEPHRNAWGTLTG